MGVWNPGPAATTGDDIFTGDFHDETANGLAGDDTLIGSYGDDTLVGGAGTDWLYAGQTTAGDNHEDGQDKLKGGDGADHLFNFNQAASSTLLGQGGDDTIHAGSGDLVDGGAGDDVIEFVRGEGWLTVQGGEGFDQLVLDRWVRLDEFSAENGIERFVGGDLLETRSVSIVGRSLVDLSTVEFVGIDRVSLSGDTGATLIGGSLDDVIYAHGADLVHGSGGGDLIRDSGVGSSIFGDDGDDIIEVASGHLYGGAGDDTFRIIYGATIDGGDDVDTVWIRGVKGASEGVVFNLTDAANGITQHIGPMSCVNVEVASGPTNSDFNKADHFTGYKYGDRFASARGDDTILGQDGNDSLFGAEGVDQLFGEKGDDELWGQQDGDFLHGGNGKDYLRGEEADDVLIGGLGNDRLKGGVGADVFLFEKGELNRPTTDKILDFGFNGVADSIDLSGVDADETLAGNQAFTYIGEEAFSGTAGELQVLQTELHRYLARGDLDGDGQFDFTIDIYTPTLDVEVEHFVL